MASAGPAVSSARPAAVTWPLSTGRGRWSGCTSLQMRAAPAKVGQRGMPLQTRKVAAGDGPPSRHAVSHPLDSCNKAAYWVGTAGAVTMCAAKTCWTALASAGMNRLDVLLGHQHVQPVHASLSIIVHHHLRACILHSPWQMPAHGRQAQHSQHGQMLAL